MSILSWVGIAAVVILIVLFFVIRGKKIEPESTAVRLFPKRDQG